MFFALGIALLCLSLFALCVGIINGKGSFDLPLWFLASAAFFALHYI